MEFRHKNIRLNDREYIGLRSYFITLCCDRRRRVFLNAKYATWMIDCIRDYATAFRFSVYAYCVMPDHAHALVTGMNPASNLLEFVKHLKEETTQEYQRQANLVLWQKKFHDHILRPRDRFEGVACYIWMNPVRAGLCVAPQEYPFSGSFVIDWKKGFLPAELWEPEWKKKHTSARLNHKAAAT